MLFNDFNIIVLYWGKISAASVFAKDAAVW